MSKVSPQANARRMPVSIRPRLPRSRRLAPLVETRRPPRVPVGAATVADEKVGTVKAVGRAWTDLRMVPWLSARLMVKGIAGTRLGAWWIALRPAADLGGKAFLFGAVFSAPSNGIPYFLFLLVGMQIWRFVQVGVTFGTRSTHFYRRHTKSLNFSPLLMPISGTLAGGLDFAVYGLILAGTFAYFALVEGTNYLQTGPELLLAAAAVVLTILLAWGATLWLSVLNAFAPDVRIVMRYVLQVWLYLTPIVYPLSFVPEGIRTIVAINPLTPIVEMFRYGLVGAGEFGSTSVIYSIVFIAVLLVSGVWFFHRYIAAAMASLERRGGMDEDEQP